MRPALAALFDDYAAYHRDPVNVRIHEVAVPAIVFHVVAMLDWVGLGVEIGGFAVTLGVAVVALAALWYAWMSPRLAALEPGVPDELRDPRDHGDRRIGADGRADGGPDTPR